MSHGTNIYKWKRFQSPQEQHLKKQKKDDIKKWLDKVEAAADAAVRSAFDPSDNKVTSSRLHTRSNCLAGDDIIQLVGDIHDNEAAHAEAKEIVTDWISDKIRFDFLDDENTANAEGYQNVESNVDAISSGIETATHEKWYEDSDTFLQKYLNSGNNAKPHKNHLGAGHGADVLGQFNVYDGDEETVVNAMMKKMMETEAIKDSDMKVLREKGNFTGRRRPTVRPRDPKMSMDIRHKEVKEARLRRQKEEEKRKLDKLIQKEAKLQAQKILKEEELKEKLKKKQEEDAIHIEMARIRKEMVAQRNLEDKRRQEFEQHQKMTLQELDCQIEIKEENENIQNDNSMYEQIEYKKERMSLILRKRNADNRRLIQSCFSTWCKLVLQQRVKLGKAKALADWKCMQKSWASWKSYITNLRLDRENKHHQASIRDMRIKEKKAVQSARVKLLRKTFTVWKVWVRGEQERKEILEQQQNTKAKMQALLNAVTTSRKEDGGDDVICSEPKPSTTDLSTPSTALVQKQTPNPKTSKISSSTTSKQVLPRQAWQVTKKDVQNLKPDDMMRAPTSTQPSQRYSRANPTHLYDPYENRHKFQKELIDQHRALLQEQKKMIKDIQEQQSLAALQKEITELKEQKMALNTNSSEVTGKERASSKTSIPLKPDAKDGSSSARSISAKKHPIVEKMEKRALERAERKKELEEMKRKKEEEQRKKMQEEEERKQREEEEKKKKEILERKEARRLQQKLEEEKKAAQERMRSLCKRSDQHYVTSVMKFHGFLPWRKLLHDAKEKLQVAKFHASHKLLRKAILEWRDATRRIIDQRNEKADCFNQTLLLRRGLARWKKYGERMDILEQKAELHRNKVLRKMSLRCWVNYTTDEKFNQWRNESRADQHNHTRLLRRVFNVIRSYRKLVKTETERRQIIDKMRKKVTRLLPDFHYSQDSFLSDNFGDADGVA